MQQRRESISSITNISLLVKIMFTYIVIKQNKNINRRVENIPHTYMKDIYKGEYRSKHVQASLIIIFVEENKNTKFD